MFKLIVALTCLHVTFARPQEKFVRPQEKFERLQEKFESSTTPASILEFTMADDGVGNFNYNFKTSDGTQEQAQGTLKDIVRPKYDEDGKIIGEEVGKGLVQKGSYQYTGDDGKTYQVDWVADEEGFKPSGAHIPQPAV